MIRHILLLTFLFLGTSLKAETPAPIWLSIRGALDPITRTYITSTIHDAEAEHRPFVVLELDLPEGSNSEAQKTVEALSLAKIPIAVYLPPYSSLGNAGETLLFASDFAVAAPLSILGQVGLGSVEVNSTPDTKIPEWFTSLQRIAQNRGHRVPPDLASIGYPAPISAREFGGKGYLEGLASEREEFHKLLALSKIPAFQNENPLLVEMALPPSILLRIAHPFFEPNSAYFLFCTLFFVFLAGVSTRASLRRNIFCLGCLLLAIVVLHSQLLSYSALILVLAGGGIAMLEYRLPFFGLLGITGTTLFFLGSFLLVPDPTVPHPSLSVTLPAAALVMCLSMIRSPKSSHDVVGA